MSRSNSPVLEQFHAEDKTWNQKQASKQFRRQLRNQLIQLDCLNLPQCLATIFPTRGGCRYASRLLKSAHGAPFLLPTATCHLQWHRRSSCASADTRHSGLPRLYSLPERGWSNAASRMHGKTGGTRLKGDVRAADWGLWVDIGLSVGCFGEQRGVDRLAVFATL